eukprot:Protomagalhaensia_sp_Gyna_25__2209@NODE_21_length_7814_cov_1312_689003_g14_i0_p8_GENE_NODE_21_length_7814_cov_1312_689003_g14_i0NODE_21_length_7814_cov_1312_689003_g14_i0_p8_ORF_typecomplete_len152_score21_26Ribosomal_S13_N/PF08069_12/1_1e30Ribosomal_S13_N/PF08069_12/4e03Ribosomal_S15/PF00312_22/1_6e16YflT/PF11181_8/0_0033HTH_7/PF02796_15/2_1e02HTH_7/PF02796_15/1_4Recombinase/PF07508_13/6_7e03Recombinase/PF07508_13/0_073HTH_23/PF13384_6/3e02HTH_23/PF13384_6/4HTH_23/PF13384_6/1_2e03_NODE_21_lengt
MARMYGHGKGISRSTLPYKRSAPSWSKTTPEEVVRSIVQLAKKGMTPSQIGVILRDSQGIPRVQSITGQRINKILERKGLAAEIPESLYFLMKKAVTMRKHMEKARGDMDCKFRLGLCESKIHRLARYYRRTHKLPHTWKYTAAMASAAVA